MALKLANEQYIKINTDGSYIVYKNEQARQVEKSLEEFSPSIVIAKYTKIIEKLRSNKERCYYDPVYLNKIISWEQELTNYANNWANNIWDQKYPLMKEYIKNVDMTIPQIICKGYIKIKAQTTKEAYEFIKKYKIFGETEDV